MAPLDKVRPNGDLLSLCVIEEDTTGGNKVLTYEGGSLGGGSQCLKGTIIIGASSFDICFTGSGKLLPTTTNSKHSIVNSTAQC